MNAPQKIIEVPKCGIEAWLSGFDVDSNPHPAGSHAHREWKADWAAADYDTSCERSV